MLKEVKCMNQYKKKVLERNSGIELLKVIAIVLIILSHTIQTLVSSNPYLLTNNYVMAMPVPTTDMQTLLLTIFSHSGVIGNCIFFICSAWFLLESKKLNLKKVINIIVEIWLISVLIFLLLSILYNGDIPKILKLNVFLPTTYASNWYMTCYVLFYLIHPLLNKAIYSINKKVLLSYSLLFFLLYVLVNYFYGGFFFPSPLILWITIYFMIAYMKLYMNEFSNNKKANLILTIIGIGGNVLMIIMNNVLSLNFSSLFNRLTFGVVNHNPFLILGVIGAFNMFKNMSFKSKVINSIASLSMLVYIIHENILLRTYVRPAMLGYIYKTFGYDYIILWVIILVLIIFVITLIVSFLYKILISKYVIKLSEYIYILLKKIVDKIEKKLFRDEK